MSPRGSLEHHQRGCLEVLEDCPMRSITSQCGRTGSEGVCEISFVFTDYMGRMEMSMFNMYENGGTQSMRG